MSIYDVVPVTVGDYRRRARRRLPRFLFDYLDGAANDEVTAAANESDFGRYHLLQRVLRDVDGVSTASTLAGREVNMPLALAPVGMAGMYACRGEAQGARAAQRAGIPFTLSTLGICTLEEVAATGRAPWFQLYMLRDRAIVEKLLARAAAAGCDTLLFTVDLPVAGMRLRDYRNGMLGGGIPGKLSYLAQLATSPAWALDVGIRGKPHCIGNLRDVVPDPDDLDAYKAFIDQQFDPTVTWEDIAWLRGIWKGKLYIKGVLEVDDARAAVDTGADGLVVSNHGGRQLDGVASSISKLGAIGAALGEQTEILLDGGIRSGIDLAKALALGADGVLMGRPWVYALAAGGEDAVASLLDVLQRELLVAMALLGIRSIDEFSPELIEELAQ
ncbi:L-lactate dehydrogenase [Seongchinamella sediminis]|uniref:L-lactate dehydrogenase n=1 Tax=Seongchinamella sediminis TaxID=2283635 RepID=A0A3L7E0E2_9GAMM|nr:L-lactate dehydrogenase [Seongchinamella sediminis]RLQ22270.1 L-lactate dehydrogenase [Seongchinamella sediminis]